MRRVFIAVLLGVIGLLSLPSPSVAAEPNNAAAESEFVARINDLRASKGLAPLAVHSELVSVARNWASTMAGADRIWHNPNLANEVKSNWTKLGENVGVGMSVDKLHSAFVNSPSHYRNLVDGAFNHVGVGVVVGRDGALFTAHVFMNVAAAAAPAPAPAAAPAPAPRPARVAAAAPRPALAAARGPVAAPAAPATPAAAPAPPAPSARLVMVLEQLRALDN